MKKKISIEGMSCAHCVKHVKEALEDIGAISVEVSLEKKTAFAEVNGLSDENIKATIEDVGYDVVGIENL
jgi:copper chaperone